MFKAMLLCFLLPACIIWNKLYLSPGTYSVYGTYVSGNGICNVGYNKDETYVLDKSNNADAGYVTSFVIKSNVIYEEEFNDKECNVNNIIELDGEITSENSFDGIEHQSIRSDNCPEIDCDATYDVNGKKEN